MPLQNRVDPFGVIHAVPERGTMMGNRGGKFHRDDKTLGKRRFASQHWICCELHFKARRHEPMGQGYTSLFFLDEVTALAAGHRPCFECRRREAQAFLGGERAGAFDKRVHAERLNALRPVAEWRVDGAFVEIGSAAFAFRQGKLLRWSFSGYTAAGPVRRPDRVLTPPSIIAILAKGYKPRWHPTAAQWDDT